MSPSRAVFSLFTCGIFLLQRCIAQKYYIYEWPGQGRLSEVYPPLDTKLLPDTEYSHLFNDNFGAGAVISEDIGLYHTWQYALFKNVFGRLLVSKYRTRDPEEADIFIIPFDLGAHAYMDEVTGKTRRGGHFGGVAATMLQIESAKEVFWKNHGHDHILISGLTAHHLLGLKIIKFLGGICQNCTMLTIETTPGLYSRDKRYGHKWWYAVPYPSSFHWSDKISPSKEPWRVRTTADQFYIFCIGSVKTLTAESTKLRRILFNQCNEENAASSCMWQQISHASNGMVNGSDLMTVYLKSTFCLCPPGDSYTRKAIFDSILSGCIPVIFYRESMYQYFWHISVKEVDELAVFIELGSISTENKNFVEILRGIPKEIIKKKQLAIEKIAPKLQYSIVPEKVLSNYFDQSSSSNTIAPVVWDPPFEDANDIIIKAITTRATIEPMTGIPPAERWARFKKYRWSDPLKSNTSSNAYEVVHPKSNI